MDTKFRNEILRLKNAKEVYQSDYVGNIEVFEEKIERLENQIDRSESDVKREILERHRNMYLQEIEKLDTTIEKTTKFIDDKVAALEAKLGEIDKEKKSFDYNIEKLRDAIQRRNTSEIFDMFENVVNALNVLREEGGSAEMTM
jgi:DNA repair exonuclease SbcCD ATPase subunit